MLQALIGPIASLAGSFVEGQVSKQKAKATLAQTEAEAKNGFDRLNELPDWYQYLVFLVCSAALGIKGLDKFRKK